MGEREREKESEIGIELERKRGSEREIGGGRATVREQVRGESGSERE